uniref:Uncharacterized protein n=1 Tax=Schizaphis graminum TaxID=13262 RepID=A0A2S2N716_SCHGA
MASSSSSTINLAANVTNSSNSKRPDLSASTSSISSSRIFLLNGCPISRKISATMSVGILPDRSRSNASKAFLRTEICSGGKSSIFQTREIYFNNQRERLEEKNVSCVRRL